MFKSISKAIFLALFTLGISGAMSPSSAQFSHEARADASIDAAQNMLAWMQESGKVVQELMPLMSNELLDGLINPVSGDTIDTARLTLAVKSYKTARIDILARSQARIDALPAPEKWNFDPALFSSLERGIYKTAKQQYAEVQATHNAFASVSGDILDSFEKVSNGEEVDIQSVFARTSETTMRVLRSENSVLKTFTSIMPENSPNKNLHQIMIALNNSSLVDMEMLAEYEYHVDPISKRQAFGRRMKAALKDAPDLINKGREKIVTQSKFYKNKLSDSRLTEKERNFLTSIISVTASFEKSFDIEQQLLDNDLSTANLYLSDKLDEDIEIELDANTSKLTDLIVQRQSVMMTRMSALQ